MVLGGNRYCRNDSKYIEEPDIIFSRRKKVTRKGNKVMPEGTISNYQNGRNENCLPVPQTDRCINNEIGQDLPGSSLDPINARLHEEVCEGQKHPKTDKKKSEKKRRFPRKRNKVTPYLQENDLNNENGKVANKSPIQYSTNDCKDQSLIPVYTRPLPPIPVTEGCSSTRVKPQLTVAAEYKRLKVKRRVDQQKQTTQEPRIPVRYVFNEAELIQLKKGIHQKYQQQLVEINENMLRLYDQEVASIKTRLFNEQQQIISQMEHDFRIVYEAARRRCYECSNPIDYEELLLHDTNMADR